MEVTLLPEGWREAGEGGGEEEGGRMGRRHDKHPTHVRLGETEYQEVTPWW